MSRLKRMDLDLGTLDLTRISLACSNGKHTHCGRQVLLPKPDKDGRMYGTCICPICKHVPDYRKHNPTGTP